MSYTHPENIKGIVLGIIAAFCAAIYLTINRYVYIKYRPDPTSYTATFLVAAGLVACLRLGWHHVTKPLSLSRKQLLLLGLNGFVAGMGLGLVIYGQRYTTAVNASIIFSATTIPTVIFSRYLLKDYLSQKQLGWIVVLFVGLYLAIVGVRFLHFSSGDLIILLATVFVGFSNTYSKILMKFTTSDVVTDTRLIVGGVLLSFIGIVLHGTNFIVTSASLWPWLAGLFLWLTIKAFYSCVNIINPNKAVILANSHPLITPFLGVLLLNEPYTWLKALGSIILLVSIYEVTKK